MNDIITMTRNKREFNTEYDIKFRKIIDQIYPEENNKNTKNKNNAILSFFIGFSELNILNNQVKQPFYYLYRNKTTKENKIFMRVNNTSKIFGYNKGIEIKNNDYYNEINAFNKFMQISRR